MRLTADAFMMPLHDDVCYIATLPLMFLAFHYVDAAVLMAAFAFFFAMLLPLADYATYARYCQYNAQ